MKKTILVLEDELTLQTAIKSRLVKSGFSVLLANKVEDAIELLKKSSMNINGVWLDHYLLGSQNGLDFMVELNKNTKWKNIPVFVVTNSVSDDKIAAYEVLGIQKYFVKSNNSLADIVGSIKDIIL